jgi:hypothetical protein
MPEGQHLWRMQGEEQLKGSCCWPLVIGSRARLRKLKGEQCWLKAMKEEIASIEQNSTWKLVKLP